MQLGMVGLGRMGANMTERLRAAGHELKTYDPNVESTASSLEELVQQLDAPRSVWLMVPAGLVDGIVEELAPHLSAGDTIVDGGNSYYVDDLRRQAELRDRKIHYVDAGVSGGVWGRERGYCLMVGGDDDAVKRLEPVLEALAPGPADAARTPGRTGDHAPEGQPPQEVIVGQRRHEELQRSLGVEARRRHRAHDLVEQQPERLLGPLEREPAAAAPGVRVQHRELHLPR